MKKFIHKEAKEQGVVALPQLSLKDLTVTVEMAKRLDRVGFPKTHYCWVKFDLMPEPVIWDEDTQDGLSKTCLSGTKHRLGPAPLADEIVLMLPSGEMAWRSEGGYFCSNRSRGRTGYRNLAEALCYSWLDIKESTK